MFDDIFCFVVMCVGYALHKPHVAINSLCFNEMKRGSDV